MSSYTSFKKIELHLHLEGAASPHFVRDICKSSGTQIPEIFDKAGNYNWQNFDQFLRNVAPNRPKSDFRCSVISWNIHFFNVFGVFCEISSEKNCESIASNFSEM